METTRIEGASRAAALCRAGLLTFHLEASYFWVDGWRASVGHNGDSGDDTP